MLVGGVRDVSAEAKARVKALYYIMQSMEVRSLARHCCMQILICYKTATQLLNLQNHKKALQALVLDTRRANWAEEKGLRDCMAQSLAQECKKFWTALLRHVT